MHNVQSALLLTIRKHLKRSTQNREERQRYERRLSIELPV